MAIATVPRNVLLLALCAVQMLSSTAFVPSQFGAQMSSSLRLQRSPRNSAVCVRMSSEVEEEESADEPINRRARRTQKKLQKKTTGGSAKTTMQAYGGVRAKPGQSGDAPKTDLLEIADAADAPKADGERKAVDLPGTKDVVMLMQYKNKLIATAPACTKCKFPLLGADYKDNQLTCKVCGSTYDLPNGEVVEQSSGTLFSGLFSATPQTRLPVYATLVRAGKVFMGVAPGGAK